MAFVKLSRQQRYKMFREGGYREREIMKNSAFATTALGSKNCIQFHDRKNKRTAIYMIGRGWIN